MDGLNIMVWAEDAKGAETIIKALEKILGENPELILVLHILAPNELHRYFIGPLEERLDVEDSRRILPGSRLIFHDLDEENPERNFKEIVQNEAIFDILVASHVFTKLERCDDETLDEPESSRDFDPFWDSPIQNESHNSEGEYVPLIKFRPYHHDDMLANWSTINQRRMNRIPRHKDHLKGAEYFYMNLGYDEQRVISQEFMNFPDGW